jgi:uncharacterized protein (DUF1697 family)
MRTLTACLEAAGYGQVRTVLSSGNVVFTAKEMKTTALERKIEAILLEASGRSFHTIIRTKAELDALIAEDPFASHVLPAAAKRVVTFSKQALCLPKGFHCKRGQATILALRGREALTCYLPEDDGPVFMELLADAFGKEITTRTWDSVLKCAKAAADSE